MDHHRPFRIGILAIAMGLAGIIALPGAASAAPTHTVYNVRAFHETFDVRIKEVPFRDLTAGDCTLNAGSAVTLSQPDGNGFAVLHWGGIGSSSHPSSGGDIWHLKVLLRDTQGRLILESPIMDSVPMKKANQIYGWDRTVVVQIPAGGYDGASAGLFDNNC